MHRLRTLTALGAVFVLAVVACGDDTDEPGNTGSGGTTGGSSGSSGRGGASSSGSGGSGDDDMTGGVGGEPSTPPATGGSSSEGGSGGEPATPDDSVTGKVVDTYGYPVEDASIIINGAATLTDGEGRFVLDDVAAPYDVIVFPDYSNAADLYLGLTRREMVFVRSAAGPQRTTKVEGTLEGLTFPLAADQKLRIDLVRPVGQSGLPVWVNAPAYEGVEATWDGPPTRSGTLLGLLWSTDDQDRVDQYLSAGTKAINLEDGDTASATLTFGSIPTHDLEVETSAPEGYQLGGQGILVNERATDIDNSPAETASYRFPSGIPGVTITFEASASLAGASTRQTVLLDEDTSELAIALKDAPRPVLPHDGASDVTSNTVFQWTPFEGGIYQVLIICGNVVLFVYTEQNQLRLPDLSPIGQSFAQGVTCSWGVQGRGPAETIDEYVATADLLKEKGRLSLASSPDLEFTLAD